MRTENAEELNEFVRMHFALMPGSWMGDQNYMRQRGASMPPESSFAGRLFISYRRKDSEGVVGRLAEDLGSAFGSEAVFRDIDDLLPGCDFTEVIRAELDACSVMLAVIGPDWLPLLQDAQKHGAGGPVDYVAVEIEAALTRGIPVIPVLVGGAAMLTEAQLPPTLKPLAKRHAHELSAGRWHYDVARLASVVARHLGPPPSAVLRLDRRVLFSAALTAAALLAIALLIPVETAPPSIDLAAAQVVLPELGSGARDGTVVLTVGLAIAWLLRELLRRYRDLVAGRFVEWLQTQRYAALGGLAILVAFVLWGVGRPVVAAAILLMAMIFLAAGRLLDRVIVSTSRLTAAVAAALALAAAALASDIVMDRWRHDRADVALLLPPLGSGISREQVFTDLHRSLRVALLGTRVEIAPDRLHEGDMDRYAIEKPQHLLAYKGRSGRARVFIRVEYVVQSAQMKLLVAPYPRPRDEPGELRTPEDWLPHQLTGPVESREIALRASFELITFLADKGVLRLTQHERQQVLRQMLDEFTTWLLPLRGGDCTEIQNKVSRIRSAGSGISPGAVRDVLFAPCIGEQLLTTAEAARQDLKAAEALYGKTLAH